MIVSRRRATGAVPGAAVFRAVRAAAGRVRGSSISDIFDCCSVPGNVEDYVSGFDDF
ncbi:hypothetical protein PAHAL_1G178700 [Panicum hallii]|uniref:Uncharacterized protein n=1 Tax=Panicum hallii TaxID=206008 RepID=A0A2T8KVQ8_9POAL|nr:hypothetical protein PAHAL_1G178700 [Panicum hallii]